VVQLDASTLRRCVTAVMRVTPGKKTSGDRNGVLDENARADDRKSSMMFASHACPSVRIGCGRAGPDTDHD